MSFWESLTGRRDQQQSKSASSETVRDSAPGTTFQSSSSSSQYTPEATDVSSFLNQSGGFDPSTLHPLAGLNQDTLDYLSLDDSNLSSLPGARSALPSRGWSDDLCYGTGTTYLAGLTAGGVWGLAEGLNRVPANSPPKLRLNAALNAITRRGPFLGNSAGVLAMVYNGLNSTLGYYRGQHDSLNSITAGFLSGAIFKSTRGPQQMLISGGLVATVAGVWGVSHLTDLLVEQSLTIARFLAIFFSVEARETTLFFCFFSTCHFSDYLERLEIFVGGLSLADRDDALRRRWAK